jgi:hypothetical protein
MMAVEITAAVAIWGAWEALKVTGAAEAIVARMLGKDSSGLSQEETRAMSDHFESCRRCQHDQERQVELLQKIADNTIEIRAHLTRPR